MKHEWKCNACGGRDCIYVNPVTEATPSICPMGIEDSKFIPRNLPKADVYSLLADVRAMKQKNNGYEVIGYGDMYIDGYNHAIDDVLKILSEHFR